MNEITLSEIQIIPIKPRNGLLAFCSFIINKQFYVGDVAIYSRLNKEGFRLVFPVRVLPNGLKVSCFHPISRESAQAIEEPIIEAFLELAEKATKMKGVSDEPNGRVERGN